MKKYEKEILQSQLDMEAAELKKLKAIYMQAADDCAKKIKFQTGKIDVLLNDWDDLGEKEKSILQSQIYQRKYQQALQKQISEIIDNMNNKQYATVSEYLTDCYENGFASAMYSLHKQGVPIIMPLDQKAVVKGAKLDSKVSKKLYGSYVTELKKHIRSEVSRGVATSLPYKDIARNLNMQTNIGLNKAMRIARTEGHNVQVSSSYETSQRAKEKGADVLKQWSAALDGRTRESHARVDGEIRELDEKFSNGLKYPGDPAGGAAEVVNCRCALLQRARWALDEDELQTLKDRAEYFGLDKADTFDDYKKKYLKAAEQIRREQSKPKFTPAKTKAEAEQFAKSLGVNADYSKYDISVANAVNETMQRAVDEFGIHALDALKSIGKDTKKGREGGFDWFTGKLSLSGVSGKDALFKMGERTRKANQRYERMGIKYFSAEGDLCVIHHEIGHAIHSSLGGSIDTAATSLDREIIYFMRGKTGITNEVSYYATINNHELVAECVAQYFDGTPSETTLGIIEILKKFGKNK